MGILKDNIDHYMQLKGIKMYTHLLIDIAHELGIKGEKAYEFATKEKSNFSKMLKDERPLKYEFIVPLEKIFGVSLARLLDEDAYKMPAEKDHVPFNKGFRYYAYLDDPKLYKEEFDLLLAKDGKSIVNRSDEFGKSFLDYVVEYHAVNGVRYMHEEYGLKLKRDFDNFELKKDFGSTWVHSKNCIEFARLVASMNDAELFYDIYDSYYMFFALGYYSNNGFFSNAEYLEIILDNDHLFYSLFETKTYQLTLERKFKRVRKIDSDYINIKSINPIINNCLRYALTYLDKYKHRAMDLLKFGIQHNKKIVSNTKDDTYCICNYHGGVIDSKQISTYFACEIDNIAIFVDIEVNDDEINTLIKQLPKFKRRY